MAKTQAVPAGKADAVKSARLQTIYREKIVPELMKKFGYASVMQVPRITKITLNMGVSEAVADKKVMDHAVGDLTKIAGQKPVVTKSKKAIAGFKIREGWPIGTKVTIEVFRPDPGATHTFTMTRERITIPNVMTEMVGRDVGLHHGAAGLRRDVDRLDGVAGLRRLGARGPGETQLETDRRVIRERIKKMKQRVEEVRRELVGALVQGLCGVGRGGSGGEHAIEVHGLGARVLVAEAGRDLEIAVEARDHQQLLEQLGRLRQREEVAVVDAAGHEVVARAFGRALGQHRGLDVDEAVGVEELAHLHRDPVAQHQVLLHLRAAQVQHAVRQAGGLAEVLVIEREGRRHAGVEHLQRMAQHLDLARDQRGVLGAGRARPHQAGDLDAELVAHAFGGLEHLGAIGVADDLDDAFAVAQIDKY